MTDSEPVSQVASWLQQWSGGVGGGGRECVMQAFQLALSGYHAEAMTMQGCGGGGREMMVS